MVPLQYRGKTVAASVFVNRMTSGTVALTFLTIKETIGADNTFFVYGGICVAATIYYSLFVTDTSGISLEEYAPPFPALVLVWGSSPPHIGLGGSPTCASFFGFGFGLGQSPPPLPVGLGGSSISGPCLPLPFLS